MARKISLEQYSLQKTVEDYFSIKVYKRKVHKLTNTIKIKQNKGTRRSSLDLNVMDIGRSYLATISFYDGKKSQ